VRRWCNGAWYGGQAAIARVCGEPYQSHRRREAGRRLAAPAGEKSSKLPLAIIRDDGLPPPEGRQFESWEKALAAAQAGAYQER
jgi:hypothetical protein